MPRRKKEDTTEVIKTLKIEETEFPQEDIPEDSSTAVEEESSENVVTLVLSNGSLTTIVREVFFLGKLGGKLTPKFLPRLKSPPYIIKVDLTPEAVLKYGTNEGRVEYDENVAYTHLNIRTVDPIKFVQAILDIGAKGGILTPKKVVQTGLTTLIVPAIIEGNIESNPVVNVLPSK